MKRSELIRIRKGKKLTQEAVANRAGIKRSYYGLIETGVRNPTLKIATQVAKALGVSIIEIFPEEIFFGNKCYDAKQNESIKTV